MKEGGTGPCFQIACSLTAPWPGPSHIGRPAAEVAQCQDSDDRPRWHDNRNPDESEIHHERQANTPNRIDDGKEYKNEGEFFCAHRARLVFDGPRGFLPLYVP